VNSKNRLGKALSLVLPGGAIGASFVLALSSVPAAASPASPAGSVAARLTAIRAGISQLAAAPEGPGSAEPGAARPPESLPTWWGNGGWGRWHPGWGNGGWGWRNGWPNWHNWGNGWNNWGNGWHNFWHNW